MGYLFNTFDFEPGSRMTGIWTARGTLLRVDQVAFAQQIRLGRDQDGSVEADFLGAHLPFHAGGFHGSARRTPVGRYCCKSLLGIVPGAWVR